MVCYDAIFLLEFYNVTVLLINFQILNGFVSNACHFYTIDFCAIKRADKFFI